MSGLTLYNYWRSSASYRVRLALHLKQQVYDYVPIHLLKDGGLQFSDQYKALNPQSRVPALQTGDHVLTQSMAIIEWLDETFPQPPLLPGDAFERARVRSLAQIFIADVQPLINVAVSKYLREQLGADAAQITAWLHEWMGRGMRAFETRLACDAATGRFCHGDQVTLADISLIPQCYAARRFGLDVEQYPHITRIEANCLQLEAFIQAAPAQQPDAETQEASP